MRLIEDSTTRNIYNKIVESSEETKRIRKIPIGLNDEKSKDVLNAVVGQLSDGMWENSPGMDKYWRFADGLDDQGNLIVYDGYEGNSYNIAHGYNPRWYYSAFSNMDDEAVKRYFAHKIKQIVKEEGLEWNRNNTEPCEYLNYNSGVTVRDAYRVYDRLLGRIDRITESDEQEPNFVMFYLNGKELGGHDLANEFKGERESARELFAYENNVKPEEIEVREVYREDNNLNEATDEEYEEYIKREKERSEEGYKDICTHITDEQREKFNSLKEMLTNKSKGTMDVDGWYFATDAVYAVNNSGKGHHMNPYMDLTTSNILLMVGENETIEDAIKELFDDYKPDSAYSWADNFLYALDKVNLNAYQEFIDEQIMEDDLYESAVNELVSWMYDNFPDNSFYKEGALENGDVAYYFDVKNGNAEEVKEAVKAKFGDEVSFGTARQEYAPESREFVIICKKHKRNINENDEKYFKGVGILDKAFSNQETENLWKEKFNKLVPKTGKAKTDIGEIMRCISSLSHAYYGNGDTIYSLQRLHWNSSYLESAYDLKKIVNDLGDKTLIDLVDKMFHTRVESAYAKYLTNFYEYFMNNYIKKDDKKVVNESEKPKDKKEKLDKRVIMQQGNVTCIKENENSYLVFENESDNETEHDTQDSAMEDFMNRVGVDVNNELKEN